MTFRDGTHTHALSAMLLNFLPYRDKMVSAKDALFLWKFPTESWVANYAQVVGLTEYVNGEMGVLYSVDYKNKTVLDIGGFIGDTARFFIKEGAKKVVIIEPSNINIAALLLNLKNDTDKIILYHKALSDSNEETHLFSDEVEGSNCFGLEKGSHKIVCQGINIEYILSNYPIDIIKIDCEGGEKHLLSADQKILQKVNYWMIETHGLDLHKKIVQKFTACGFSQLNLIHVAKGVQVVHFVRDALNASIDYTP